MNALFNVAGWDRIPHVALGLVRLTTDFGAMGGTQSAVIASSG